MSSACEGIEFVLHQGASGLGSAFGQRSSLLARIQHQRHTESCCSPRATPAFAASSTPRLPPPTGTSPRSPSRKTCCRVPLSPYAVQKLTCEYYIQSFYRAYGLEGVCLRYFNIFGPRQAADSPYSGVIAQFTYKMMDGRPRPSSAMASPAATSPLSTTPSTPTCSPARRPSKVATGRVFNIGTGKSRTLNEVYKGIASALGFKQPPLYGPERAGDVSTRSPHRARPEGARLRTQGRLPRGPREDRRLVPLAEPRKTRLSAPEDTGES